MYLIAGRKLATKTPVYDHAGELQGFADLETARRLLESPYYIAGGTRRRVRCFRAIGPDPSAMTSGSGPRPGIAAPHRRETYHNPAGVLAFNYLPRYLEADFRRVLQSVTVRKVSGKTDTRPSNVVEMPRQTVVHAQQTELKRAA